MGTIPRQFIARFGKLFGSDQDFFPDGRSVEADQFALSLPNR
jgi:hypothetical protein